MRAFIDRILAQIRDAFGKMESKNRRGLFIIIFLILTLALVGVILLSQTRYVPLNYFDTVAQAEQAYARLQAIGVNARREGTRIMVPENQQDVAFAELRDAIGTPRLDSSIMDAASGFGVTDMHQKEAYARQLADDIRVQILQSPRISNAVVIVRPGETSPFRTATNLRQPSASVMLTLTDSGVLSKQEAQTVAALVAGAVPGISFENIQIADSNYNHYRVGDGNEDFETVLNSRIAMKNMIEQQLKESIEQVFSRVFLRENIEIIPSVTLNFDKVSEQQIIFTPPVADEMQGLIRSESDMYEHSRLRGEAGGIPGTDSNYMGMGEYPWGLLGEDDEYIRRVRDTNYELNETIRTIEREEGYIESMTVSILVNSDVYMEDMSEAIIEMVAMGVNIPKGNVVVISLPFVEDTTWADEFYAWEQHEANLRQQDLIRTIIIGAIALVIAVLLFLLGKSIINAVKSPQLVPAVGGGVDYLADDDMDENALLAAQLEAQRLADIDLKAKQGELNSIEGFIDRDPAAVAQLLRNWLTDD